MAARLFSRISGKGQVTIPKRIRDALGAAPGDIIAYEVKGKVVTLKRLGPFDAAYHSALSRTLDEWTTPEDEEAFRDL